MSNVPANTIVTVMPLDSVSKKALTAATVSMSIAGDNNPQDVLKAVPPLSAPVSWFMPGFISGQVASQVTCVITCPGYETAIVQVPVDNTLHFVLMSASGGGIGNGGAGSASGPTMQDVTGPTNTITPPSTSVAVNSVFGAMTNTTKFLIAVVIVIALMILFYLFS